MLDTGAESLATGFIGKYVEYGKNTQELNRQAIPGFFYDDGNVYIVKAELLRRGERFGTRVERVLVDREQNIDVDEEFDLWFAEQVLTKRQRAAAWGCR
jgi:CMP-N-acetylneuraminic acid synthetase